MAQSENRKRRAATPTCKALLLCDRTIVEAGSGKVSLIGTFDRFGLAEFPGKTAPFQAFLQVTDACGKYDFAVELRDLQADENVIARVVAAGIEIDDPLRLINLIIAVLPLPLQSAGEYDFVVLANDEEISHQKFQAVATPGDEEIQGGQF